MTDYAIVLCTLIGLVCLWPGVKQLSYSIESVKWPCVDGVITRSRLEVFNNGQLALHSNSNRYHWSLRYQFMVDGVTYKNHRAGFSVIEPPVRKRNQAALINAFPVASTHAVYYLPKDPNINTLQPGFKWNAALLPTIGLLFLAASINLYFYSI